MVIYPPSNTGPSLSEQQVTAACGADDLGYLPKANLSALLVTNCGHSRASSFD